MKDDLLKAIKIFRKCLNAKKLKMILENPKKSYSTENLTLKIYIGRKLCEIIKKNANIIRGMKT